MGRGFRAILILWTPSLAVLAGLVLIDRLGPAAATIAAGAILVGLAALARFVIADVRAVEAYWLSRAAGDGAGEPRFANAATADLSRVLERLDRARSDRVGERPGAPTVIDEAVDALPDPLLVLDAHRHVVRANAAARGLLGAQIDGLDLAMSLRHPAALAAADAVLRGARAQAIEFALPGSIERHFAGHVAPLPRTNDQAAAAIVVLHDLTSVKRAERLRADFVANASHELRTPLSALLGFVETLRGPAQDDAAARQRFLPVMHQQASRMARLVDDLLSLSRIEMNEHTAPTGRANLKPIVQGIIDGMEVEAKAKQVAIETAIADALSVVVGDEHELGQVFQNLLDNALKYGREKSTVHVVAVATRLDDGAAVALSVRDEGDGIAREHLPRLTERFYRVDTARSRTLGGTGLGLAIVKHIVNRHRGHLGIESTVGEGSTFTVTLALAPTAPVEADPAGP